MSYNEFAYYYDSLMDEAFYDEYIRFILPYVKDSKHILELGCGTGTISIELAKKGLSVYATDLSNDMIDIASFKVEELEQTGQSLDISFDAMDMTHFRFPNSFDAILCLTDSMNYLSSLDEVKGVLECAYQALVKGGVLIFDVHAMHKVDVTFLDYHEKEEDVDFKFDWHVQKIDEGKIAHHVLIEEEGEIKVDEVHIQQTYPVNKYLEIIKETNFKSVEVFSDFHAYNENDDRVIFVVKKGE